MAITSSVTNMGDTLAPIMIRLASSLTAPRFIMK